MMRPTTAECRIVPQLFNSFGAYRAQNPAPPDEEDGSISLAEVAKDPALSSTTQSVRTLRYLLNAKTVTTRNTRSEKGVGVFFIFPYLFLEKIIRLGRVLTNHFREEYKWDWQSGGEC